MKTKEELNALKEEVEALNKKLAELSEEELKAVSGGINGNTKILCDSGPYLVGSARSNWNEAGPESDSESCSS